MFDVASRLTYKEVPNFYKEIIRICDPNIPIVLCGNKVDVMERKVKPKNITLHRKKHLPYYEISNKENYNLEKPFLWLLKKLVGNDSIELVETPALPPVEANNIDISKYQEELGSAANVPLPAEDDGDVV